MIMALPTWDDSTKAYIIAPFWRHFIEETWKIAAAFVIYNMAMSFLWV